MNWVQIAGGAVRTDHGSDRALCHAKHPAPRLRSTVHPNATGQVSGFAVVVLLPVTAFTPDYRPDYYHAIQDRVPGRGVKPPLNATLPRFPGYAKYGSLHPRRRFAA